MSLLSVAGIRLYEHNTPILQDISFTQPPLQKLAIAGQTGAGKSTLLQIIAGLVQPTAGEVRFEGRLVKGPQDVLVPGHPGVAYLSQYSELPRFLRVEQVLRYANKLAAAAADQLYDVCQIRHLAARRTDQLSGGEKQRIALTRLLLASPKLLLLDEPFSNLDRTHKQILKTVIQDIGDQLGITCILVSHDPTDTLSWADEILVLQQGRLIQKASPALVYQQPVDEYTAALFGEYNLLSSQLANALSAPASAKAPGKQLLVRPEQLLLSREASSGVTGRVLAVRFFGSYSEVQVDLAGTRVAVRTSEAGLLPDMAVGVSLSPAARWFL